MNTKNLTMLIVLGIAILVVLSTIMIFGGKNNLDDNNLGIAQQGDTGTAGNSQGEDANSEPVNKSGFVVVRVLPSGFSPNEVTIEKGMIVRFTNPLENQITLTWEGETQYTSEVVFTGNDVATIPFDTAGEYTFTGDATNSGKVIVK